MNQRLTKSKGGILQSAFIASIRKRVEDILDFGDFKADLYRYMNEGKWPRISSHGKSAVLSWYLQWFGMPPPSVITSALAKIKSKVKVSTSVPLLHLLLPGTHINALLEIDKLIVSSRV